MQKLLFLAACALMLNTASAAPVRCSPGYQDASCASPLSAPPQTPPSCSTDAGWQTITAATWIGSKYSTPVCSYTAPPTCPSGSTQATPATWNGTEWLGLICRPRTQTCPAGQTWDGTACVPSTCLTEGGTWNSTTAVCNCPIMKTWSSSHCQWTGYRLEYSLYWGDYTNAVPNMTYDAVLLIYDISSIPYNVGFNTNPGTRILGKIGAGGSIPTFRLPTGTLVNMWQATSDARGLPAEANYLPMSFTDYPNHSAWSSNTWFTDRGCKAIVSKNYNLGPLNTAGEFYAGYKFAQWCPSTASGASGINGITATGTWTGNALATEPTFCQTSDLVPVSIKCDP